MTDPMRDGAAKAVRGVRRKTASGTSTRSPLIGRDELLHAIDQAVASGGSVMLTGTPGVGKSSLLRAAGDHASSRGDLVIMVQATEAERWSEGTVLTDAARCIPEAVKALLPADDAEALVVERVRDLARAGRAWLTVLSHCAEQSPVTFVIDDIEFADTLSIDVLTFAIRRLPKQAVRILAASDAISARELRLAPDQCTTIDIPALSAEAIASIVELYGLPARTGAQIFVESAGNPLLASTLAAAATHRLRPEFGGGPVSPMVSALVHEQLARLDGPTLDTLVLCALAFEPTLGMLERAGRLDAAAHIQQAQHAGIVAVADGIIRFTPSVAATSVLAHLPGTQRATLHDELAVAVTSPQARARHRGLADPTPSRELTDELGAAGDVAYNKGQLGLAAELYSLAAEHCPVDAVHLRLEWLAASARMAAAAGREELVYRNVDALLADTDDRWLRVRARLALVRLAGNALGAHPHLITAASQEAGDDPRAIVLVELWRSHLCHLTGDFPNAIVTALNAVDIGRRLEHDDQVARGMSFAAVAARAIADPRHTEFLAQALAVGLDLEHDVHAGPHMAAAHAALLDDDLEAAAAQLNRLLVVTERKATEEFVAVLCDVVELHHRQGRCQEALTTAERATRLSASGGLGPAAVWVASARAELAGGSLQRGLRFAAQSVKASEQDRDVVVLRQALQTHGHALWRTGKPADAIEVFARLAKLDADHGVADPTSAKYHGDYAMALVAAGRIDDAESVVANGESQLEHFPTARGIAPQLLRARGSIAAARDDVDVAESLVSESAKACLDAGLPLEQGHSYLVLAQINRQRRRYSSARAYLQQAEQIFRECEAFSWLSQCGRLRAHLDGQGADGSDIGQSVLGMRLTESELRIARLVVQGATNKEIAQRLYLSVKTVEATLTRVYRKLGVASRAQLSAKLAAILP